MFKILLGIIVLKYFCEYMDRLVLRFLADF